MRLQLIRELDQGKESGLEFCLELVNRFLQPRDLGGFIEAVAPDPIGRDENDFGDHGLFSGGDFQALIGGCEIDGRPGLEGIGFNSRDLIPASGRLEISLDDIFEGRDRIGRLGTRRRPKKPPIPRERLRFGFCSQNPPGVVWIIIISEIPTLRHCTLGLRGLSRRLVFSSISSKARDFFYFSCFFSFLAEKDKMTR